MKIKLPKGSRTFSGDIILERRGGQMWDELKKWVNDYNTDLGSNSLAIATKNTLNDIIDKMNEIEKQHGIDYV